jgi:hypothetical protein
MHVLEFSSSAVVGVTVAMLMALAAGLSAQTYENFNNIPRAAALQSEDWPTGITEVIGYDFQFGALSALSEATLVSDSTGGTILQRQTTPTGGYYCSEFAYRATVTRSIKIQTEDSKNLGLTIRVHPSLFESHMAINQSYFLSTFMPHRYRNIVDVVNDVGDVCIVHDAMLVQDGEKRVLDPEWDVFETRSLYAFYHNVFIHISVERNSEFQVLTLLQQIIADMEAQRVAADGQPELPDVTLDLATNQVDGEPLPGAEVSMSYSATWDSANCERRLFVTRRIDNKTWNEEGEIVPDTQEPYTYRSLGTRFLDDADNPTKVRGFTPHISTLGHYHVVLVAWGDNLLPKIEYKPLEVTEP